LGIYCEGRGRTTRRIHCQEEGYTTQGLVKSISRQGYPVKDNRHGNFVKDIPQKPPIKDPIKDIRSSGSTLPGGGHMTSGEEVIQYQEEGYTLKEGI
jgi:hypothetical protein